ncbi:relaxase [Micromonospora sp. WMMD1102]|uniref:relaxase/mobilization nuclease domain-containing protein n=1 Tax=Micromonospora sp. WMMD1102 TaxID=3016105 RepID=UPI00241516F1|nr:relaxase [Micromonospora sp. WMMD1102]MDG4784898.1 relaxase [Micromonospora sp. WMMD1102]
MHAGARQTRRPRGRHRPAAALIPAIHPRGTNVGGLLRYLFGPGKAEEHVNPHLVAAWSGPSQLPSLEPPIHASGRHDIRALARLLEQPVRAGRNPPLKFVWHASVRNHITDRILSDSQWAHIAAEIVAAVGIAPHGDPDAVRWVAVRHADDHIHIVATLVRQDGETAWAWNERLKAQSAARDLEQRYGLYQVGPVDHTSHRRPTPAEQNKSHRQGRPEIPRDRLRREVRAAAAAASDENDFVDRLQTAGVLVRLRHSTINPDEVTGYAVGLPDHHTSSGDTVWYGGGRLAPDLTLPQLRRRWDSGPGTVPRNGGHSPSRPGVQHRTDAFRRATTAVDTGARHLGGRRPDDEEDIASLADAAADVLASTARAFEGRKGGPLTDASETFDRAMREPQRRHAGRLHPAAGQLRSMSRLISAVGRLTSDDDTAAALQLVLRMSMVADNLARLREAQGRLHQAQAARQAAEDLRELAAKVPATLAGVRPAAASVQTSSRRTPSKGRAV